MLIVLVAAGKTLDLDACAAYVAPQKFEASWRLGDRRLLGRVAQDNGFTLTLAEEELAADAFARARSRLKASSKWIARLTAEGAQISIEFGVFVPAGAPRSVAFPKDLLKCMVEMDLSVVTRAYPVAEDEDE